MGKMFIFLAVLAMCAIAAVDSAHAPGPAVDCSTLILNVADCLTFVSNGSKEKKPQSTCCSGLKKVLKIDADCLCEAFKSSAQLGVSLNMTKAISLPSACGVSTSPLSKCGVSLGAPGSAPAQSPTVSPKSPSSTATSEGITAPVPAPIPGATSSACSVSIPFMLLFSVVVVASCSFF